jgi:hypothetical protein
MTTLYTHVDYFSDHGNGWYGRWGRNKQNACRGNGFGASYDKGMYSDPRREQCGGGGAVMAMDLLNGVVDPKLEEMDKANASGG